MRRTRLTLAMTAATAAAISLATAGGNPATAAATGRTVAGAFRPVVTSIDAHEPSVLVLPGTTTVLALGPTGQLSALDRTIAGKAPAGIVVARSVDGGRTFPAGNAVAAGAPSGGGDADIARSADGTLLLVDLDSSLSGAFVCISRDSGRSWTAPLGGLACATLPLGRAGVLMDRPWVTGDGTEQGFYLTYHDALRNVDQVWHTADAGVTWTPCAPAPVTSEPYVSSTGAVAGLGSSKPVLGSGGRIYWAIHQLGLQVPGAQKLYLASFGGGCATGSWKLSSLYSNPGALMRGSISAMSRDAAGTLYLAEAGPVTSGGADGAWLFVGPHDGASWQAPVHVSPGPGQVVFATTAALAAGKVAVGYYASPNSLVMRDQVGAGWRYYVSISRDGGRTFTTYDTSGEIRTTHAAGDSRSSVGDFASLTVDRSTGQVLAGYNLVRNNASPEQTPVSAVVVSRQTTGPGLR